MNLPEANQQAESSIPCLSVVIPVYNEESTLSEVVLKVLAIPGLLEVGIVDDCWTDGTPEIIRKLVETHPQVKTSRQNRNAGKTAALRTGFALTQGEVGIVQDADLDSDRSESHTLIQPILDGSPDVV